jgi:hypothetical protein
MFGDATIVFLLLNEIRHRIVARLFGASRKDSNIVTGVAVALTAAGAHTAAVRMRGMAKRPSGADTAIGAVVLKEAAHGVAGDWSKGTPLFATLITFVVLERSFGPALRGALRSVRMSLHGIGASWRRVRAVLEGP